MGTNKTRHEKIQYFRDILEKFFSSKPDQAISKSKLVAKFAIDFNSTQRTGNEIITLLSRAGMCKIEGDNIIR